MVLLVNAGTNRLDAVVKLDQKIMGLGDGAQDGITVEDADPELLTYFMDEHTTMKAPEAHRQRWRNRPKSRDPF